jgi:hypothetical protein
MNNGDHTEQVDRGRSAICNSFFFWAKGIQPMEIHSELVTICGPGVMAVQWVAVVSGM